MPRLRPLAARWFVGVAGLLAGCATPDYRTPFVEGRYADAEEVIDEILEDRVDVPDDVAAAFQRPAGLDLSRGNVPLYTLEKGYLRLVGGDPVVATRWLEQGRLEMTARFDSFKLGDYLASALLDDKAMTYVGADYEHIVVRFLLSLSELVSGGGDAYAYASQIGYMQQKLLDSDLGRDFGYEPRKQYQRVAVGAYLQGIVLESNRSGDTALIYERAQKFAEPRHVALLDQAVERVKSGRFAAPGHGAVHVFYLAGAGPDLESRPHPSSDISNRIGSIILADVFDSPAPLFQTAVFLPTVVPGDLDVPPLAIRTAAGTVRTEMLLDVNQVAAQQDAALKPFQVARALVRRTLKGSTIGVATKKSDLPDWLGALLLLGATAAERTDLRSWKCLPAQVQAARLELPEGEHSITFGNEERRVQVRTFADTYVVVLQPNLLVPPTILVDARSSPPPLTDTLGTN